MATTGFWPVKSRLKEVIDYAENPDKTIDKKYVDSDLYAALQYAADDKKTDERMLCVRKNTKGWSRLWNKVQRESPKSTG